MTYIITYTGKKFDYANIQHEMIDIEDIAHALSHTCRYNGHCNQFYSVAQHSVLVANMLIAQGESWDTVARGLLHDATEAYMSDLVSPLKELFPEYKAMENSLAEKIAERFQLSDNWSPIAVHAADKAIVRPEMECLIHSSTNRICGDKPCDSVMAKYVFIEMFDGLNKRGVVKY